MAKRRQVMVDGRSVSYLTAGSGPAVVLLHGIGGNATQWNAQLDGLSDEFTLIAWDTPGYGESDDPGGEWRMGDYAEVLAGCSTGWNWIACT